MPCTQANPFAPELAVDAWDVQAQHWHATFTSYIALLVSFCKSQNARFVGGHGRYATRIFAPDELELLALAGATRKTLACAARRHGGEELTEQVGRLRVFLYVSRWTAAPFPFTEQICGAASFPF